MATRPSGVRIVEIKNQRRGAKSADEEWLQIDNDGSTNWKLIGWLVTDETPTQERPHEYRFPPTLAGGGAWTFDPGESIYLFTGSGRDAFIPRTAGHRPQFHFYWGRRAFVWNNTGDRAFLRHPDGTFATEPFPVP